jgi:hypothetical protein
VNYYAARQREKTKKWDYTCRNDGRIWPVGYCAGRHVEVLQVPEDEREPYHDHGHETAEEARECYKHYQLDNELHLDIKMASQQRKCEADGCGAWTQGMARVGGHVSFVLCDEHRNRENVEKLYSVGESWTS